MFLLDHIIRIYDSTIAWPMLCKRIKVDSVFRRILMYIAILYLRLTSKSAKISDTQVFPRIIVSLTTFPARINKVWMTIYTLINQSLSPDKIILYLSKEQFADKSDLPKKLLRLQEKGLEIRFVNGDYKSHKKYLYAFQDYPDDFVMLADDDILYPSNTVERLRDGLVENVVHCSYGSKIMYTTTGEPFPYVKWQGVNDELYEGPDLFFGSGGGTMLKPSNLPDITTDIKTAMKLCPTADDVWLNAMCRLANMRIKKVRCGLIFPTNLGDKETLCKTNVGNNQNDVQIKNIQNSFNNVFNTVR